MRKHIFTVGYCVASVALSSCGGGSQENQDQQLVGQEEISATGIVSVDTADATDLVRQPLEVIEEQEAVLGAGNPVGEQHIPPFDQTDATEALTESESSAQPGDLVSSIAVSEALPDESPDPLEEALVTPDPIEVILVEESSVEAGGGGIDQQPNISALQTQPTIDAANLQDATAFPGALGWAAETTTGGRGGRVVIVDTLSNAVNPNDGVTSFREAMTEINEPRIIVFSVAGLIDYRSGSSVPNSHIRTNNSDSNVTIACQTAPPPGVTLMGDGIVFANDTNNVIMRHCRFRNSDPVNEGSAENSSCIRATGTTPNSAGEVQRNYVIDHVSCMWSADDSVTFSIPKIGDDSSNNMKNITISNSIVAEGDADSLHGESGKIPNRYTHSMGPGCASSSSRRLVDRCSIVRNFIAHNGRRNGRLWAVDEGELIDNIVYNPEEVGISAKQRPSLASHVDAILSGNLIQLGPTSKSVAETQAIDLLGNNAAGSFLEISGNYLGQYRATSVEPHNNPLYKNSNTPRTRQVTPSLNILEMSRQGSDHLRCVGASRPQRDSHDARVIEEFHQQSGQVGIMGHHERDFSEYDTVPTQQRWPDTDLDGMPDSWESKMSVDDANGYNLSQDYTNLEVFLNRMALCPSVLFESESISVPAGTREVEIRFETTWETWSGGQTLEICIDSVCESYEDFTSTGSFVASLPYDANYQISMTPIGADGVPEPFSASINVLMGQ